MNSGALADMLQYIRDRDMYIDNISIVRNGYLVMDAYFYPFPKGTKHNLRSCSKSIISALIGIAIEKKYINDVNQPVLSFFPDKTIANMDENKKKISVKHLLTMSSGLDCQDSYRFEWRGLYEMWESEDWVKHVLDLPMVEIAGEQFEYCNGSTYLLSAILQKATGMKSLEFARKFLFSPMGITDTDWETSQQGINYGYDRLWLTPHDIAKIGWLYLNKGKWNDKQLISPAWVEASSQAQIKAGTLADQYGYQWWIEKGYYLAIGSRGQFIFIAPRENIVAVFTSAVTMEHFFMVKDFFKNYILPSVMSFKPLRANHNNQKRLDEQLNAISTIPAQIPPPTLPKMAEIVSGHTYEFGANALGLESLSLTFPDSGDEALLSQKIGGKTRQLSVGLDNVYRITKANGRLYAYKGVWEGENIFTYSFKYVGGVDLGDTRLEFKGKELIYNAINRSFGRSFDAFGKLSEAGLINEKKPEGWTDKVAAAIQWMKELIAGKPDRIPDLISNTDILGAWTGSDNLGAKLTFNFKENSSFDVDRKPSQLGRPSTGKYIISGKKISGDMEEYNVTFTAKKFGNEISGEWVYKKGVDSGEFTIKKQ